MAETKQENKKEVEFDITKEEASMNQYWYSKNSIDTMVAEVEMHATKAAFLSAPSLFFNLTKPELRANSKVFEFDRQWDKDPGFVYYDYNHPDKIPVSMWDAFDYVVVDPPFITREVWQLYGETVKLILKKGGKVLFTSVIENHAMLEEVCGVDADTVMPLMIPMFRPSIPNLTYQYVCFNNYPSAPRLCEPNPELPPEDPKIISARQMCNDMRESQKEFAYQVVNRDREGEVAIPKLPAQQGATYDTAMKWTRVPAGLTEYADGASAPPQESAPQDFGPKYNSLVARRQKMEEFRKLVDAAMKLCDSAIKVSPGQAKKDAGKSPEELEAETKCFIEQKAKVLQEMDAIKTFCEKNDDSGKDKSGVCVLMGDAIEVLGPAHELTVQQYKELSADTTRLYKSKVFNRQKELLAEMKIAKKEHLAAASTTTAA